MSRLPDNIKTMSEALFEVMGDIGVTEKLVMKRRRSVMLMETINNISQDILNYARIYQFGSQSEGSTTFELKSDTDVLYAIPTRNIMQCISQWKCDEDNLLMIQNEKISPGYCYLQLISDLPNDLLEYCVIDREGGLLLQNTYIFRQITNPSEIHGPAITEPKQYGFTSCDRVYGFYGESSPHQVLSWVQKQRKSKWRKWKWPTEYVLKTCKNSGCFVVPVSSKVHSPDILEGKLEWRISTSLQERYLMFSLNIPQLMCYILMKMILKTHINPFIEDLLTSFMCKNVLLYCVANSSHDWHSGNLLAYLHLSLFMLKECIEQRNCPHFILPENNLLAGRMTDMQRSQLLDIIYTLIKNDEELLFEVQIDDLGERLKMKVNNIPYCSHIPFDINISQRSLYPLVLVIASTQSRYLNHLLNEIKHESLKMTQRYLFQTCSILERNRSEDDLQHSVSDLLVPLVSSTLGSVIACNDLNSRTAISDQAFNYLEVGKESDALSGRLKLVSVLYCTGDMERTERELNIIETQYNMSEVHTTCGCIEMRLTNVKAGGMNNFDTDTSDEKAIKNSIALCTRFLQAEINCVPHELRYEIMRSYIGEDKQMWTDDDSIWMDLLAVDSILYLYYLQYKTYGRLQKMTKQHIALYNFTRGIEFEPNLRHKETAINLLGQCYEQENNQTEALRCYISSLKHRMRSNAAQLLLCLQLFKLWKQYNIQ